MTPARRPSVDLAIVHHANQHIITRGYDNREGIDELVGGAASDTGFLKILELHRAFRVPLNLHLSGTLLEALLWHRPEFFDAVRRLHDEGLLAVLGSSYGQNIMRFFTHEHNLLQLNEELRLYRDVLEIDPRTVNAFWPPERVWDTERLAPALTDPRLLNGGYRYVLVDDRLLRPLGNDRRSRRAFDRAAEPDAETFAPYRILHGQGLIALPIARALRQNIPPTGQRRPEPIEGLLRWLAEAGSQSPAGLIAIYGDDLEKAAGVGAWPAAGAAEYAALLDWLCRNPWVRVVTLGEALVGAGPAGTRQLDVGTFLELAEDFGAGEGYEGWYLDAKWDRYRGYCAWSEQRVKALSELGADRALIELAWKQVLASTWETAWHTPPSGVHGDPAAGGEPSPWARAVASHSRHAAVTAEAAYWMRHKDDEAHAYVADLDNDGQPELIVKNDRLFAVVSPAWGGRLVALYNVGGPEGKMVVGNPCDDWNWMEELNKYQEVPPNHPGALTEIDSPHDRYEARIETANGPEVCVTLVNREAGSPAAGLEKTVRLAYGRSELEVTYRLPEPLPAVTVECGLSPDYLRLLRDGRRSLEEFRNGSAWGCSTDGVAAWLRLDEADASVLASAVRRDFGHGEAVRFTESRRRFTLWIGSSELGAPETVRPATHSLARVTPLERTTLVIQETGDILNRIDQMASPYTSRTIALELLTSPELMVGLFQRQVPAIAGNGLVVRQCRPKVLKQRLGSRQVVSYALTLAEANESATTSLEVVAKRYVDGAEGERAFRVMQTLWHAGFGEGSRLNIPRPLAYLPGFKLLIQETARGVPLPEYLSRGHSVSSVRILSAARWLARLHALTLPANGIPRYEADESAVATFARHLGDRVPDAARVGDLAAAIVERLKPVAGSAVSMVHGDYHPENIFVTKGGATVIDFDGFGLSHPARDLGYFVAQLRAMAHLSTGSLDAFNRETCIFMDAYRAALPPEDPEAWAPAVIAFAARASLETLYYILCVVQDRRRDVLSTWLQDIERFLGARHLDEVTR